MNMPPKKVHPNTKNSSEEAVFFKVVWVIILGVVCIILIFSTYKISKKYIRTRSALHDSQVELHKLQNNESQIIQSIDRLSTDPGREYEVREKYRVVKQGEKLIVVIDDTLTQVPKEPTNGIFENFKEWLYR